MVGVGDGDTVAVGSGVGVNSCGAPSIGENMALVSAPSSKNSLPDKSSNMPISRVGLMGSSIFGSTVSAGFVVSTRYTS